MIDQTPFLKRFLDFNGRKWIYNLTSVQLPCDVFKLLSLRPDYGVPYTINVIPIDEIICNIEQKIYLVDKEAQLQLRTEIANILRSNKISLKITCEDKCIIELYEKTDVFMKKI